MKKTASDDLLENHREVFEKVIRDNPPEFVSRRKQELLNKFSPEFKVKLDSYLHKTFFDTLYCADEEDKVVYRLLEQLLDFYVNLQEQYIEILQNTLNLSFIKKENS